MSELGSSKSLTMMSSNAIAKDDHKNVEYVVETVTGRMDKNNSSSSHGSSNDENHLPSLHLYATSSVMTIIPHSTNDSEEQEVPFLGSSSSRSTLLLPMAQPNQHAFLPDFTEHPKPRKKKKVIVIESEDEEPQKATPPPPPPVEQQDNEKEEDEITFFHDFVAGGVAGSASVIVGHPFDTYVNNYPQNEGLLHLPSCHSHTRVLSMDGRMDGFTFTA